MIEYITSDPHEMPASEQEPDETMNSIQQNIGSHYSNTLPTPFLLFCLNHNSHSISQVHPEAI